ncbi:MAG: bifunctional phosphopantothenoylcysteine decarboxylase/phosphopantothenate--cysteine ligase CoaBC [Candidatus Sumerlaeia bacterium]|nr:bifunctional phosphopantothenoylcysteine decarboxylase/phosphopantothenate--cysteine ligase CoaBC [Candidatus Sumerlaeia bacterium]
MNILLGVSSSIAIHRALDLASNLRKKGHEVQAVLSRHASNLITPAAFEAMTGRRAISSIWDSGHTGEMDHLATTKWADHMVFVPASANTLATLAHGIAADALGTFAIAFNRERPFLIAPAMNPEMWRNPAVQANVETLKRRGHRFIGPVVGPTACGDFGLGRLAAVADIEQALTELIEGWPPAPDLSREHFLVTAGPTREFADDVRFLSNPSTGKMAFAIADDAARAGAAVTLISGPVDLPTPPLVSRRIDVTTADEMLAAVLQQLPQATTAVFAAAVSDWKPAVRVAGKLKKRGEADSQSLELARTPDVALAASLEKSASQLFVGFAAESSDILANAEEKLSRKRFDFVFANPINEPGAGFGTDTNRGTLLWADGRREPVPDAGKRAIARRILAEVAAARVVKGLVPVHTAPAK